jgi:hypothetical protein
MKHYLILLLNCVLILACLSCKKKNSSDVKIDLNIKSIVEKHISNAPFTSISAIDTTAYYNEVDAEIYSGNPNFPHIMKSDTTDVLFNSSYFTESDTIILWGSYELGAQLGFIIKIIDKQFHVYHLVSSSSGDPRHSLTGNSNWKQYLEVPCLESKVILSQKPTLKSKQPIYGYIEFKSRDYFYKGINLNDTPQDPKDDEIEVIKSKTNMKIYFKSIFVNYP